MKKLIYWLFPAFKRANKIMAGLEENHIALIRLLDDYQRQTITLRTELQERKLKGYAPTDDDATLTKLLEDLRSENLQLKERIESMEKRNRSLYKIGKEREDKNYTYGRSLKEVLHLLVYGLKHPHVDSMIDVTFTNHSLHLLKEVKKNPSEYILNKLNRYETKAI
jgi:hypothetical protein